MFRIPGLLSLLLVAACKGGNSSEDPTGDDTDTTSDTPQPEADVHTWRPTEYAPADPARLVFLGDSITAGDGENDTDQLYKNVLQENTRKWDAFDDIDLESLYPDLTDVIDVSVGGATTDSLLDDQLTDLEDELTFPASGETIVVFTIGGNDLQAALTPFSNPDAIVNQTLGNLGDIIDWLQDPAHFPDGVWIYATNVYEPTDGVGQSDDCFYGINFADKMSALTDYNDAVTAMAQDKGFSAVDLRGHFLGHGHNYDNGGIDAYDAGDPTLWMLDDCIHPNPRGHHELRRLVHAAITGDQLMHIVP